jgi:gamma-glutamyltranspeptidase
LIYFDRHGKVPWADLFTSAIRVAEEGFQVTDLLYSKLVVNTLMTNHVKSVIIKSLLLEIKTMD